MEMPYRTIRDLIFQRIISRLSLDIGYRNPYIIKPLNSLYTLSSVVLPDDSNFIFAYFRCVVVMSPIIRSSSIKSDLFNIVILIHRFLILTPILNIRNTNII
jgi:hypothetical protein